MLSPIILGLLYIVAIIVVAVVVLRLLALWVPLGPKLQATLNLVVGAIIVLLIISVIARMILPGFGIG